MQTIKILTIPAEYREYIDNELRPFGVELIGGSFIEGLPYLALKGTVYERVPSPERIAERLKKAFRWDGVVIGGRVF